MEEIYRHMDAEQAERYVMGNSPEARTAALEEHLLVCARCRTRILQTDAYLSSMSDAAMEILRKAPRRSERNWQLWRLLWAMAAVAGGLLLGILAFR